MQPAPVEIAPKRHHYRADAIVAVVVLSFLVAMLVPAVQSAREAARRATCIGNLKMFGLALMNYEQANKSFPPAYIADRDGRRMHSWRVLILPYMECEALYNRFDFNQPWDAPGNLALAEGLPAGMSEVFPCYRCISDRSPERLNISYAMIVGDKAFAPGPTTRTLREITDGTSQTIWLGEYTASGIHSLEPRDLDLDAMSFTIKDFDRPSIRGNHPGSVNVALADGSVACLKDDTDPRVVRAMLTIGGKEKLRMIDRSWELDE